MKLCAKPQNIIPNQNCLAQPFICDSRYMRILIQFEKGTFYNNFKLQPNFEVRTENNLQPKIAHTNEPDLTKCSNLFAIYDAIDAYIRIPPDLP